MAESGDPVQVAYNYIGMYNKALPYTGMYNKALKYNNTTICPGLGLGQARLADHHAPGPERLDTRQDACYTELYSVLVCIATMFNST